MYLIQTREEAKWTKQYISSMYLDFNCTLNRNATLVSYKNKENCSSAHKILTFSNFAKSLWEDTWFEIL